MAEPGPRRITPTLLAVVFAAIAVAALVALLVNIFTRKQEAQNPFYRVVELTETTDDPMLWGKNFPLQYDQYLRTIDQVRTKYGGSEALPRTPTQADPRSVVARSRLERDPRLTTIYAGYAFSKDFRERRGHAYMLEDQIFTGRQQAVQQPGTCLHCHGSMVVPYREAGGGDLIKGFEKLNPMPYQEAVKHVKYPVACIDCHDPKTMQLRITRPGFIEGMRAYKEGQGIKNYDVNTQATRQEMRSYVCGQCHVEYYFKGKEKRLTYPWNKGLKADEIMAWYDELGFKDWVHKDTGTQMLKAQHPEFETFNQGIHARSGVACADCHMPYMRVGALKISDHDVRSPVLNINHACQTCHRWPEQELKERVEIIQDRHFELRNRALDAVVALIGDLKSAKDSGRPDAELDPARSLHRKSQWLVDFVESENSMGFHAPQESARVLAAAIDLARQGQLALRSRQSQQPATSAPPQPAKTP